MARVLIVDDDADIRISIGIALESEGHVCLEARDGQEGLEMVECHRPDVVLLDYMMPKLDGAGFCHGLPASGMNVPVILMSADKEIFRRAENLSVAAVVRKPFDVDDLLRAIDEVWRKPARH